VGVTTWYAITGTKLATKSLVDQLWEPKANIEYAAKYLVWLRNYLGEDLSLIIAAYNGGPANPVVTYTRRVNELRRQYD
jgi:soluble lytic murein transglycosylase-like protein